MRDYKRGAAYKRGRDYKRGKDYKTEEREDYKRGGDQKFKNPTTIQGGTSHWDKLTEC